jgi:hypothetical protein
MTKWSALSTSMSICATHVKFDNLNGLALFTRGVYRDLTTFPGGGRVSVQHSAFPGPNQSAPPQRPPISTPPPRPAPDNKGAAKSEHVS